MSQESFLSYRHNRWFWITASVLVGLTGWYLSDRPLGGRNGGTVFGYTVGVLSATLIFYLMWFGVRKRSYRAKRTTLQGWLSAHVWIGIGLSYAVLLHCGFDLGLNVHSLAYVLMVATIISGIWGAVNYRTLPYQTPSNRGGASIKTLIDQLDQLGARIQEEQQGKSGSITKLVAQLNAPRIPTPWGVLFGSRREVVLEPQRAAAALEQVPEEEIEVGHRLIELIDRRLELLHHLKREMRAQALLKLWLFFHVPLAFGSVVALLIHLFVVVYYRDLRTDISAARSFVIHSIALDSVPAQSRLGVGSPSGKPGGE